MIEKLRLGLRLLTEEGLSEVTDDLGVSELVDERSTWTWEFGGRTGEIWGLS